jgi:hypothetical protein
MIVANVLALINYRHRDNTYNDITNNDDIITLNKGDITHD